MIDREKAQIGMLISLQQPTQPMKTEAASADLYTSPWGDKKHPRLPRDVQLPLVDLVGDDALM
jgi:hypothetical protein